MQVHLSEWQHLTMYLSFCFSGIIDIVSQKVAPKRLIVLEKAGVALAFVITSLLLFYHRFLAVPETQHFSAVSPPLYDRCSGKDGWWWQLIYTINFWW